MRDRFNLSQFYHEPTNENKYNHFHEITDNIYLIDSLFIEMAAIDFPDGTTNKLRKSLESQWKEVLPKLSNVKHLGISHRVDQDFFDSICQMNNLQSLYISNSFIEDISPIINLPQLKKINLDSFSKLKDISSITLLDNLTRLSIENSFKIENFEVIGAMTRLIGLKLNGNILSPKNLRIKSLKPYETLKNLKHLDIIATSVIDGSYESLLEMKNLERFDITIKIPKALRDKIKINHKSLKAGFFMDWDYENNIFIEGKER